MKKVYIKNYGVHQQFATNSAVLSQLLATEEEINPHDLDYYNFSTPSVLEKKWVSREDCSVLNSMSKMAINALIDFKSKACLDEHAKAFLYTACDSEEHSFSTLFEICRKYNDAGSVWKHIQQYKEMNNPLDMLRLLPTNVLYHTSKLLRDHEEGTPLRAASLSGLVALKLAWADIVNSTAKKGAMVVSAANMLTFDSLAVFKKFGEIRKNSADASGIIPSWGAAVISLDNDSRNALAELTSVTVRYCPKVRFEQEDWESLMGKQRTQQGEPDVIISYNNGIRAQKIAEYSALEKFFPRSRIINYKAKTGYTGKLNNILDILCCLNDPAIPSGARVMLNGAGINYGIGNIWLIKS
ncbi:hypothetical protein JYZ60_003700 [Salmonella enterica subsp. enterica serovar Newport]|nr:hypothetical protein [Salmonella enterica subsp. enterica serovar Newport]